MIHMRLISQSIDQDLSAGMIYEITQSTPLG